MKRLVKLGAGLCCLTVGGWALVMSLNERRFRWEIISWGAAPFVAGVMLTRQAITGEGE